jgi:hypothetical protein
MKNKLLLSMVVIVLCVLPAVSFSETGTTAEKKSTFGEKMEARKNSVKNSVEERRQNAVNKIIERVNKFADIIIARYEAAIDRLGSLADRIESRITKIEAGGINESEAKELLTAAKTKIETAKISVANIASTTTNTSFGTTTATVKEDFEIIKTLMEKAKSDIKTAHAALIDVVNSLKPGDNKLKNSVATTTENND